VKDCNSTAMQLEQASRSSINTCHTTETLTVALGNLPDTGAPSEMYEAARSSDGRVAVAETSARGDSA